MSIMRHLPAAFRSARIWTPRFLVPLSAPHRCRRVPRPLIGATLALLISGIAIESKGPCWAQNPPTADATDLELQIQRQLRRLEDRDIAVRQAAEDGLVELGEAILPLLPSITPQTSAETKERLERVRQRLDKSIVENALKPTHLTLHGTFSLADALQAIEKQTGNRVVDYREQVNQGTTDQAVSLTIDCDGQEFWPALDQILDDARFSYYVYVGQTRMLGIASAAPQQRKLRSEAAYQGLFRIAATEMQSQRNLRTPDDQSLRIGLEILWEPRVAPVLIRHAYRDVSGKTDTGADVKTVGEEEAVAEVPVQSTVSGVDLVLPLGAIDRRSTKIAQLKGRFMAMLPVREHEYVFENLSTTREVTRSGDGIEITLERPRRDGSLLVCSVRLKMPPSSEPIESHLDWASNNVAYLVAPDGSRVDNPNFERYLEREREIGFRYLFPVPAKIDGYRFVYRSPSSLVEVPVDYELHDIDLP